MNEKMNMKLKDFLTFKCMITPMLVQVFFWAALALTLVSAVTYALHKEFLTALLTLALGPLFVRALCETMIVLFSINDSLKELKNKHSQE